VNDVGHIVVLNGAPRAGKSSIVRAVQETFDGVWINLGVDTYMAATPARYRPGIGLRPGGERADLEPLVRVMYAALYESIAAHARLGLNVVTDVGHHDGYATGPLGILGDCARRLRGLPALLVGVRCPIQVIMERRNNPADGPADGSPAAGSPAAGSPAAGGAGVHAGGGYVRGTADDPVPAPVRRWQDAVHVPGVYDLEVDTSVMTPRQCAEAIRRRLEDGPPPTALERLLTG
jgi:chloramphenicol 3-O phosphotransferase